MGVVQQLSTALYSKIAGVWFWFPGGVNRLSSRPDGTHSAVGRCLRFFPIGYVPAAQLGYIDVPGVTRFRFPLLAELDRPSHRCTQKNRAQGKREY